MTEESVDYREIVRNSRRLWIGGQIGALAFATVVGLFARFGEEVGPVLVDDMISRSTLWLVCSVLLVVNVVSARLVRDYVTRVDMITGLPLASETEQPQSMQQHIMARIAQAQIIVQGVLDVVLVAVIMIAAVEAEWKLMALGMVMGLIVTWVAMPELEDTVRKVHERLAAQG